MPPKATDHPVSEHFPQDGNTRARAAAKFLSIGLSSFHLYVKQGRIKKPIKLSVRTSVWDCKYIRRLSKSILPPRGTEHPDETNISGRSAARKKAR